MDPFGGCLGEPVEAVPPVDASDLVSYLVLQTISSLRSSLKLTNLSRPTISSCVAGLRMFVRDEWQENMSRLDK